MHRFLEHGFAVLSRVVFIGFGIQIVLGILWMGSAFAGLHGFGEGAVCAGQLLLFLGILFFFLRNVCGLGGGMAGFGCMAVATFPMILQCHLTTGTASLALSALLLEAAGILCALRSPEKNTWRISLAAWIVSGLCREEYLWIGAIPMLFFLMRCGRRSLEQKKSGEKCAARQFWLRLLAVAASAGIIAAVGSLHGGEIRISDRLACRLAWTSLEDAYEQLPGERRDLLDPQKVLTASYEPGGMERELVPWMRESLGDRTTGKILWEMAGSSWRMNRGQILKELFWDLSGYLMPAAVVPLQLEGRAYHSYSGVNYRQILLPSPKLGRLYMDYGCRWFLLAVATTLILGIVKWMLGHRIPDRYGRAMLLMTCLGMAVVYTLSRAGRMDYKNTAFILCMELIWTVCSAGREARLPGRERDEDNT